MSAEHINAFCVDHEEEFLFAGDKSGQLWVIDPTSLKVLNKQQTQPGTIQGMAAHPRKKLIALLGKDRRVSVFRYGVSGDIHLLFSSSIRDESPDDLDSIHSECQGIAFHPNQSRLVTRSGNSGVLEISFDEEGNFKIIQCVRACGLSDLATVAYTADGARILAGSVQGHIAIIEQNGHTIVHEFPGVSETMHWFEPLTEGWFLVANDSRKLLKFHPDKPEESRWGPIISRDDLEHVTWNQISGRIMASSFDRNIYEINPETLDIKSIVFQAPFKLRWIRTLRRAPDHLIAQVRDGSLLRIDLSTGKVVASIKYTPDALWSMATTPEGSLLAVGEGGSYWEITAGTSFIDRSYNLKWTKQHLTSKSDTYTKRVVVQGSTGDRFFGRTDGSIWVDRDGNSEILLKLESAVRDLAVMTNEPSIFAATESGEVLRISTKNGSVEARFISTEPIWGLALNEEKGWISAAERLGRLYILNVDNFAEVASTSSRLPKRMRWLDGETMLVTRSADIDRITYQNGQWVHEIGQFEGPGNTVEDFDWSEDRRYLVAVTYNKLVTLFDLQSGRMLHVAYDGLDYIKGVIRIPSGVNSSGYNYDFMTVGRTGVAKIYRIHDEQLTVTDVSRGFSKHES